MSMGWWERLGDAWRVDRAFELRMGRRPRWLGPRDFSDKLQWLKIHHRDPQMVVAADKLAARELVRERIGTSFLTPLLGVWEDPDAIDFATLPERFALKLNFGSGRNLFCEDRTSFDETVARKRLRAWLREDYGRDKGEWHYARMPRRILAEPFLAEAGEAYFEFKFFSFQGEPRLALVLRKRDGRTDSVYLDLARAPLAMDRERGGAHGRLDPAEIPFERWEEMQALARRMAEPFPFVRVDLVLLREGAIRFGELTFFPLSGMTPFEPPSVDRQLGEWLELPRWRALQGVMGGRR